MGQCFKWTNSFKPSIRQRRRFKNFFSLYTLTAPGLFLFIPGLCSVKALSNLPDIAIGCCLKPSSIFLLKTAL